MQPNYDLALFNNTEPIFKQNQSGGLFNIFLHVIRNIRNQLQIHIINESHHLAYIIFKTILKLPKPTFDFLMAIYDLNYQF